MKAIFKFFRNLVGFSFWTALVAAISALAGVVLACVAMIAGKDALNKADEVLKEADASSEEEPA